MENSRKRITLACDNCRKRRRKCDGVEPTCSLCDKRGSRCHYSYEDDKRKPPSRSYVEALKARITLLEGKLEDYREEATAPSASSNTIGTDLVSEAIVPSSSSTSIPSTSSVSKTTTISVDELMDPFGKLNYAEDGQLRFFGPRSSLSFITKKLDLIRTDRIESNRKEEALRSAALLHKFYTISDELRDHLLELFWIFQNSSVLLVSKDLFMGDMVQAAATGSSSPSSHSPSLSISSLIPSFSHGYYSLSLLSAMLAIGSRFSDRVEVRSDPNDITTAGLKYAELAKFLLYYEREYPKLTTIQASGLLAMFHIFIDMEASAWDYCGMAVRSAVSLGLNLRSDPWLKDGDITDNDHKLRKIIWWGCYVLEKTLNNILGRPASIKRESITAMIPDEESIDEYSIWNCPTNPHPLNGSYSRLYSTTIFTIELFIITAQALDHLYLTFKPAPKSEIESSINKANLELVEFEQALPIFMRFRKSGNNGSLLPHVYIFHLRYYHTQILLHRIFLREKIVGVTEETTHLTICRESANAITKIIKDFRNDYGLKYLDFSCPDLFCTAAIIHLYFVESTDLQIRNTAIKNFRVCVQALKDISNVNLWSRRSLEVLKALIDEWNLIGILVDAPTEIEERVWIS